MYYYCLNVVAKQAPGHEWAPMSCVRVRTTLPYPELETLNLDPEIRNRVAWRRGGISLGQLKAPELLENRDIPCQLRHALST